jgi:hypothetical protein
MAGENGLFASVTPDTLMRPQELQALADYTHSLASS